MKKILATLAVVGITFLGTAQAQNAEPISDPKGSLPSLSFNDITPLLTEMGYKTKLLEQNNQRGLLVTSPEGNQMLFQETVCRQPGVCSGLWMMHVIEDQVSPTVTNTFNAKARTTRASVQDGFVFLDRYLIADYGTARGSLAVNVNVFNQVKSLWGQFKAGASGTANSISFDQNQPNSFRAEIDQETRAFINSLIADGYFGGSGKIEN